MAAKKKSDKAPKTCAINRQQFKAGAPKGSDVMKKLQEEIALGTKHFSSGGFGYYGGGKVSIKVGDEVVRCQVGINISVVNSKVAEDGEGWGEAEASTSDASSKAA